MNDYPKRILILYGLILSLLLLFVFLPIAIGWKIIGTIFAFIIASSLWWQAYRYRLVMRRTAKNDFLSEKLDMLPARQRYRLPILLVTGNAAKDFFPKNLTLTESNVVVSSEAVWVYVEEFTHLSVVYDTLMNKWPDMSGRVGVFLALAPEMEDKQGLFVAKLQAFRQVWVDTCRIAKYQLPVYLSTHIGFNDIVYHEKQSLPVTWFKFVNQKLYLIDHYLTPLKNWMNDGKASTTERERRLILTPFLNEVQLWLEKVVLDTLMDTKQPIAKCKPEGVAIYPINNETINDNLLQTLWLKQTSLILPNTHKIQQVITPPDELVKFMPIAYPFSIMFSCLCKLTILTSLFLMAAMAASYWNNIKFSEKIQSDISYYQLIPMDNYDEKKHALSVLKSDMATLNDYQIKGEPVRLGLGFYHGKMLQDAVGKTMSDYVAKPPEPEKIIVKEKEIVVKQSPSLIRLDSLALFESGQSVLKPNSNKILINALFEIKKQIQANQGTNWLILITGHTDSTGDANKNIQLSLERATAVRNWISHTSDIPDSCFAIQGYGAKNPLVSNDSAEDRAKNRRVEISLVPQMTNCSLQNIN